jgi:hypothetical protein
MTKILYLFIFLATRSTFPAHLIFLDIIRLIILYGELTEQYNTKVLSFVVVNELFCVLFYYLACSVPGHRDERP